MKRRNKVRKGALLVAAIVAAAGITTGCGNKDNGSAASATQTTGSSTAS